MKRRRRLLTPKAGPVTVTWPDGTRTELDEKTAREATQLVEKALRARRKRDKEEAEAIWRSTTSQ